jgi:hypothetical protein
MLPLTSSLAADSSGVGKVDYPDIAAVGARALDVAACPISARAFHPDR